MSSKSIPLPTSRMLLVLLLAIAWTGLISQNSPCLAADAANAAAAGSDQPTIQVQIQGVLLDFDGKPVNEGFLMLRGNPHLNALTGYDGRFRITGKAWTMPDVLLASWTSSKIAMTKIDQPGRWLGVTIRLERQDADFTKIEMGSSLKTGWSPIPTPRGLLRRQLGFASAHRAAEGVYPSI